jgi:hypothetical protein
MRLTPLLAAVAAGGLLAAAGTPTAARAAAPHCTQANSPIDVTWSSGHLKGDTRLIEVTTLSRRRAGKVRVVFRWRAIHGNMALCRPVVAVFGRGKQPKRRFTLATRRQSGRATVTRPRRGRIVVRFAARVRS